MMTERFSFGPRRLAGSWLRYLLKFKTGDRLGFPIAHNMGFHRDQFEKRLKQHKRGRPPL